MPAPILPPSAEDFARLIQRIDVLERASRQRRLLKLADLSDVRLNGLADTNVLTWIDDDKLWEPGTGAGVSISNGLYSGGGNTTVGSGIGTVAIEWSPFTSGFDVMDLTDPAHPTVLANGFYFFNATLLAPSGSDPYQWLIANNPPTQLVVSGADHSRAGLTLAAPLAAGDDVLVGVSQGTGGDLDFSVTVSVAVIFT